MITITYDRRDLTVRIHGHSHCHRTCGAMSMLIRGYGVMAIRYSTMPGEDFIQFDPRDLLDYEALLHGLECITFFNEKTTMTEVLD